MEKGEGLLEGERISSLPLLLWRSLSSADHYDAATLPRKLFQSVLGTVKESGFVPFRSLAAFFAVSVPHQLVTRGERTEDLGKWNFSLLLLSLTS